MSYQSHCLLFRNRHVLRTNHSDLLYLAESLLTLCADLIHLCLFEKSYFMVIINIYIYIYIYVCHVLLTRTPIMSGCLKDAISSHSHTNRLLLAIISNFTKSGGIKHSLIIA